MSNSQKLANLVAGGAPVTVGTGLNILFEGSTNDEFDTTLGVVDPTADRIVLIPDASGTVLLNTTMQVNGKIFFMRGI